MSRRRGHELRHYHVVRAAPLVAAFFSWLPACAGTPAGSARSSSEAAIPAAARRRIPPSFESLESATEDTGETAEAGEWEKAGQCSSRARAAWSDLRPRVLADGASQPLIDRVDAALARLEADVRSADARAAALEANALGGALADLADLYSAFPLLRLDVAFRRVQLGAKYADWSEVSRGVSDAQMAWTRWQAGARARMDGRSKAASTAQRIDRTLAQLATATETRATHDAATLASEGLELVDEMEKVFP
mgnify:CR=1 FL=1